MESEKEEGKSLFMHVAIADSVAVRIMLQVCCFRVCDQKPLHTLMYIIFIIHMLVVM